MSGLRPDQVRAVFGTSNGDGAVVHAILETLARPDGQVSPTQFHNSVHNAAAGYWMIGAGSRQPATCIGCHDATAGMALLSAAVEAQVERAPVLLCVYDAPMPPPLHEKRPTAQAAAAALVLAPAGAEGAVADISVAFLPGPGEAAVDAAGINPAALMLPLIDLLGRAEPGRFRLPVLDGHVEVTCSTACRSPR